jgi:DNA adenine methylase
MPVMDLTRAAAALGRVGGRARTERKTTAARSNGKLGGRPSKGKSRERAYICNGPRLRFTRLASIEKLQVLRYPGAKRWLVRHVAQFVLAKRPRLFVEPFCGSAVVGLSLLHADLIDELVLCELDRRVAAFWRRALEDPSFATQVRNFNCTRENVEKVIADPQHDLGMWTLVQNRCGYGGRLGSGLLRRGDGGRGIASRWNGQDLYAMLRQIRALSGRIRFIEGDGVRKGLRAYDDSESSAFVDPPYSLGPDGPARHLYEHHRLDHQKLLAVLASWRGRWIATYPDTREARTLANTHGLSYRRMPMRTAAHKTKIELILSNRS